jgi:exodeoxyribonuclease V beta subunit
VHFIEYLHTQLRRRKDLRHVHTFDDLLTRLYEALTGRSGAGLVRALSRRYRAALIDEFQDTDPVQYAIFHRIFSAGGTPLLFIGDPKQAIYSFRGADIFTYITAAGDVDHRHTLSVNYRSTPGLTQAVNTLFSGHANPFIYADAIPFRTVASPPERPAHEGSLAIPGLAPMRIMYLGEAFGGKDGWIDNKTAMPLICRITAEEIVRLVESEARIDQRPLRPADIAVLVQTRHEGRAIKKALSKVGLPSVLRGAGSVFESRQAIDLVAVLQAIAGGYNEALVRAALCTPLFGWNGEQLIQSGEQGALEQQYEQFQYYRELWERRGFMAMFRALAEHHDLRATVLGRQDGERCLTNLLHLAELLHHREIESPARGISALIRWFLDAIDSAQAKSQEHELRLESDDDAVRIITIHKSKGLEYPVVFCPVLWSNAEIRDQALTFHDPADGYRTVYDLGSVTQQDTAMCHATRETLAENMRLLYVALTRAKSHCTLFWGRFRAATTSAPAWLFHGNMLPEGGDAVASLRDAMKNLDDHTAIADLRRFAHRSSGTVAVEPLMPPESDGTATFLPKSEHALACRRFTGHIPDDWHLTSFTSLLRGRHENPERPEQDFAPPLLSARQTGDDTEAEDSLFAFPRGPRAGTLLHSILEQADLSACSMDDHRELVEQQLGAYGFDTRWTEVLCQMLLRTGGCSLPDRGRTFRLADIPGEKWLNELEFYFPLQRIDPVQLRALIGHPGPGHEPLAEQIGSLTFSPVRGFMHGFIDCLFENDGRYYIIDWKSNWLGNRYSDYGQEQLQATMLDNLYHLQYLIYSVAVHRHLRWRLTAYDYEKHFGGVYYLFLRGIGPAPDASMGIFADRPPAALIERLNRELIGPHS